MRLPSLLVACVALAACSGDAALRPMSTALAAKSPAQPVYSCANADVVLGTLITLVQRATHVPAPAAEAALLPPLRAARVALVAKPCDKTGALNAMQAFKTTVDANARALTTAQVLTFHAVANSVIGTIKLVP
jgi:hypothetical protein